LALHVTAEVGYLDAAAGCFKVGVEFLRDRNLVMDLKVARLVPEFADPIPVHLRVDKHLISLGRELDLVVFENLIRFGATFIRHFAEDIDLHPFHVSGPDLNRSAVCFNHQSAARFDLKRFGEPIFSGFGPESEARDEKER
jgi:hypothetical protein